MSIRKISIVAIVIVLLVSCRSTETETVLTDEEQRILEETRLDALELLMEDSIVMTRENISFTDEQIMTLIPEEILVYSEYLPLYDKLLADYRTSIVSTADDAARKALDWLGAEIELDIDASTYLFEPLTPLIEEKYSASVSKAVSSCIEENYETETEAYERLRLECSIIKANYDNLKKIGEDKELPDPVPIEVDVLSAYIVDAIFDELLTSETYLRNKPVTDADNQLYNVFWEEV